MKTTHDAAIAVRSDGWFEILFTCPDGSRARITGPDGCGLSYSACEKLLDEHELRANAKLTPTRSKP